MAEVHVVSYLLPIQDSNRSDNGLNVLHSNRARGHGVTQVLIGPTYLQYVIKSVPKY